MLEDYANRRKTVRETVERLHLLLDDPDQNRRLDFVVDMEGEIYRALEAIPHKTQVDEAVLDRFVDLTRLARDVMDETNRASLDEADAMQREANRARRTLFWEASALIPVTLLLSALFAYLLSRPIRRIDEAIQHLGAGDFSSEIAVRGPRDLELLGERLDWLRRRLMALEAEKAKFLAHVSHELKTPLTAIREGGEILSEGVVGSLTREQREVMAIVRNNSVRLQRLIENLLRFSVDQAKGPSASRDRVDLAAIIAGVLADHKPALLAKEIELSANLGAGWVAGDGDRLQVVVDNLVSNAVKFTPAEGTVRVSLKTQGAKTVIEVCDTGPGIAPEERRRIFDPFFTAGTQDPSAAKGTGLGLSIVAEYVGLLGGDVDVTAGPEGGARFRVRLPLADPQATP
jgi:two-component system sensor histidine kinase GlrK